ncbi:DUF1206 domain-containing protein [Microbacterium sp. 18062]|uniref:DUF1206 domain-containing protein n=1 Tax=Microbacterium sp. 18062 TaxID=2681410 RepID=UPI00135B1836|nr:DUF1206 domain-containing protein [Microbacterium sp. 18062]
MTVAKDAARATEKSPVFRVLARSGYAANGIVHMLIGAIVLAIVWGAEGESDQSGAFKAIGSAPAGFVALWALAIALAALGVWHAAAAVLARGEDGAKKWGLRMSEGGQAVVFVALAVLSGAVALGAKPDADDAAQSASRGVLAVPGGPFLLGAVGLGIGIAGIVFAVMGVRRSFRAKMTIPSGPAGSAITTLGVVGFVAKGVALLTVGVLVTVAAVRVEPDRAGGLDGAISALLLLPLGSWLVGAVGAGFIAYGVFCGFRARYARL